MSWGTVVSPLPEQSAVCLPELHLQVQSEGQEERKSDVERFTRLTTNSTSNIAAILEILLFDQQAKHLELFETGLRGDSCHRARNERLKSGVREGGKPWLADLSVIRGGRTLLSPFHNQPLALSPNHSLTRSISSCPPVSASSRREGLSAPEISLDSISCLKISHQDIISLSWISVL